MIITIQEQGGFRALTGSGSDREERILYPVLTFVCCDNKEAVSLASIKSGQTPRPCRHCLCELSAINAFADAGHCEMRDGIQAGRAIDSADKSFLKDHSIHGDIQVGETSYFPATQIRGFLTTERIYQASPCTWT